MAQVTELAEARSRRLQRLSAGAPDHPALRWSAAPDYGTAHRRRPKQSVTWCGAPGPITIALPGTELCPACYARVSGRLWAPC